MKPFGFVPLRLLAVLLIVSTLLAAVPRVAGVELPLTEHPRLYFTASDLPRLRGLREGGVHARIWKNLTRWADWAAAQPLRAEWIPTAADDPQYENLYDRFYGAMHDMAIVEHLAFAAALADDEPNPYLEPAKAWTLAAATVWKHEADNPPDASKAYAVLRIMKALAVAYDLLYHDLTADERAAIRDAVVPVCEAYYQFFQTTMKQGDGYNKHHASVDAPPLGVAALALLGDTPEAAAWLELVLEKHTDVLLPDALTESGTNSQSSNFWASSLQYRIFFVDALRRVTGRDLLAEFPRALPGRIALAAVAGRHPAELEYGQLNGNVLYGPSYGQLNYWSPVLLYIARHERRPIYQHLALMGRIARRPAAVAIRDAQPPRGTALFVRWLRVSVVRRIRRHPRSNLTCRGHSNFPEPDVNEAYLRASYREGQIVACLKKGALVVHAGGRPVLVDQFNKDEVNSPSEEVAEMLVADDGRWARIRCVGPGAFGVGEQLIDLDRPHTLTIRRHVEKPLTWWFAGPFTQLDNTIEWPDGTRLNVTRGMLLPVDPAGFVETKVHYAGMKYADPQPVTYPTVEAQADAGILEIVITTPHPAAENAP